MKKRKNLILLLMLVITGVLSITSCHKDEQYFVNLNIVWSGEFFPDGKLLIANGQSIQIDTCKIDKANSSDGVRITSVDYYFDGEKIATTKSFPYGLSHLVNNASSGSHTLKIVANVDTDEGFNFSFPFEYTVNVASEPPSLDLSLYIGDDNNPVGSKAIILDKNEPFTGSLVLNESNFGATISKVRYYWDGELFNTSSRSPYTFNYDISNESASDHTFLYEVTFDSDYGEFTQTYGWIFPVK